MADFQDTQTGEIWKDIPGYEGQYEVSSWGRIGSWKDGGRNGATIRTTRRVLRPGVNSCGYECVVLHGGNAQTKTVHSLVLLAFVGHRPFGLTINHKDLNKRNNRIENLEYMTHTENIRHAIQNGVDFCHNNRGDNSWSRKNPDRLPRGEQCHSAKLTEIIVLEIRRMWSHKQFNQAQMAIKYGINKSSMGKIINRKSWKHI